MHISIVIPVCNDASHLEETYNSILSSVSLIANNQWEIIVVDDGSSIPVRINDITKNTSQGQVRILRQDNRGRFYARYEGILAARYNHILLIDARVSIGKESLSYLVSQLSEHPDRKVWSGHVNMGGHSIYGNLMDSLTKTVWRAYFAHPSLMSYNLSDFDRYPKGTTTFFAPRQTLIDAFEKTLAEARGSIVVSDDTRMIRHIASVESIWLSPEFCSTYTPRNISGNMLSHMWHRGEVFYDGYKKTNDRFGILLKLVLIATPIAIISIAFKPIFAFTMVMLIYLGIISNAFYSKLGAQHVLAQFLLLPLYLWLFVGGIWGAFIRDIFIDRLKLIHDHLTGTKRYHQGI